MRASSLTTKSGQTITLGQFTVLVGPNNVGKSQTLRDIHSKVVGGASTRTTLIESVTVDKPNTFQEVFRGLTVLEHPSQLGQKIVRGITANLVSGEEVGLNMESFEQQFNQSPDASFLLGTLGRFRVSFLDASSRLLVASATPSYNPHISAPTRLLQGLFASGSTMEQDLREAFKNTFAMDIRLDYSGMTQLALRVANEFEPIPEDPRVAYPVMSRYNELDTQGDGFRSFVGVVLSLLLSEGRIILLDEPEAFLHPAQARRLGYWVANYAQKGASQIIVATHNSNFLSGILAKETPVDIYRLNRVDNVTTYHKIAADAISQLTRSPLLSSQSVLDAVFHKGVVVCEADTDRAIYQTVALREFDNQNVLFLHGQSKQTVKDVVALLKGATIPVCAVVDIDIFNSRSELGTLLQALDNTQDFTSALNIRHQIATRVEGRSDDTILRELRASVIQFSEQLAQGDHTVAGARSALRRLDTSVSKWSPVKQGGVDALDSEIRDSAKKLIEEVRKVGLWIVPVGELESWIEVGTRVKKQWAILALEALYARACPVGLHDFVGGLLSFLGEDTSLRATFNHSFETAPPAVATDSSAALD